MCVSFVRFGIEYVLQLVMCMVVRGCVLARLFKWNASSFRDRMVASLEIRFKQFLIVVNEVVDYAEGTSRDGFVIHVDLHS